MKMIIFLKDLIRSLLIYSMASLQNLVGLYWIICIRIRIAHAWVSL